MAATLYKITPTKVAQSSKMYHHMPFQDPKLSDASVVQAPAIVTACYYDRM
jgi:hypothetical protein